MCLHFLCLKQGESISANFEACYFQWEDLRAENWNLFTADVLEVCFIELISVFSCVCLCVHAERDSHWWAFAQNRSWPQCREIHLYIILKPHIQIMNRVHCKCIHDTRSRVSQIHKGICVQNSHTYRDLYSKFTHSPTHLFMHWLQLVMMRCKVISNHEEKCSMKGQK